MDRGLVGCGVALVALIGAGQSLHDGSELRIGNNARMAVFVAMQMVAAGIYLVAVLRVLRRPARPRDLLLVLGVAAAMRAIPLASPMFLSSDLFRYIWDGRVQLAGINPYRYIPGDPALASLRDTAIFSHVNRAMYAPTIYPPMAELAFAAIAWIGQTPVVMRAAMVAFEAVAVAALIAALRCRRQPASRVLIYAWGPLPVWEFAGNGHVDAIAVAFTALALLGATMRRPGWTGVALGAAVLVKFLPAVLAPALWRPRSWRMPVAGALTVVALYACYAGAGRRVLGFLPGYAAEEGMGSGSGFWALSGLGEAVTLPRAAGAIYLAVAAAALAALGLFVLLRRPDPAMGAGLLIVAVMVALSPHYTWYYAWVSIPAVLAPQRAAIFLGAAAFLLYLDPLHERFIWPALVYVPTLALLAWDMRRPVPMTAHGARPCPIV